MEAIKVLLVEDEVEIRQFTKIILKRNNFEVSECDNGEEAVKLVKSYNPNIVLLDVMLPGIDGFETCRRIREISEEIVVIMLTARREDMDRIMGFEFGADDYIVKPFNPMELLARIKAIMKRVQKTNKKSSIIKFGSLKLDLDSLSFYKNDIVIDLTQRELKLLQTLFENENKALSRDELLDLAWGRDFYGDFKTVDVHIRRLREKIEDNPSNPKYIQTIWGVGYCFRGDKNEKEY